ncbi:suppressor of cytokine signaling 2-like isoform X1 [Cydia fagiglandana]|uniref:suppressor of cytokine signaling 2-like isoform X1 n=1 Tax=Cydia fagiglandana TaxID=1458189 RepID=UPI002FEE0097
MCLLEKRKASISPLDMTLAARYPQYATEVALPLGWPGVCCPNCRQQLLLGCKGHYPAYATPTSPLYPAPYNEELKRLADTVKALRLSGWYYGNLDWQGARNLLKEASVGAFVVRDSGDRNFIFSLSVQTERGPTSVRLHFECGFFRLDCEKPLARYMPRFRCVAELVQHYARSGRAAAGAVWVDRAGAPHSAVLLRTPRRSAPPSLLHCARLAIHRALDSDPRSPKLWSAPKHRLLPLPTTLLDYLGEYPYSI